MPLYDYACESCGHVVEVAHGVHDPGPAACERCGGRMRKQLSTPTIVFKGSGWAKKDARAGAAKGAGAAAGGDGEKGDREKDAGGEKPAEKAPAGSGSEGGGKTSAETPQKAGDGGSKATSGTGKAGTSGTTAD